MDEFPRVSVVIVNLNGKTHLNECLKSLMRLDYPKDRLEVIIVDNGSQDGSVEYIEAKFGWVKLIRNSKNEGFAKPSNDGARAASGDYVAFLNNDMKVQRNWLIELIRTLKATNAKCAGSVILNWNGRLLDFAGGSTNFYGMGYQYHFHEEINTLEPFLSQDKELLFACGGAMIADRRVFLEVGGFDEDYFAYFEDVDLGWRLNILGYKIMLSAKSRVYHKHHSTGNRFAPERMSVLYNRNSLYTIYKNYSDEMLSKVFWPTLLMDNAIIFEDSGLDRDAFDIMKSHDQLEAGSQNITNQSAAQLCAIRDLAVNIDKLSKKRAYIQANRKVDDKDIIKFMTEPYKLLGKSYDAFYNYRYKFIKSFGIDKVFQKTLKRTVLLVCNDELGNKLAGPAIRYWEMAKNLADTGKFDVILACLNHCSLSHDGVEIVEYSEKDGNPMLWAASRSDILIIQGYAFDRYPALRIVAKNKYVVSDIYDPYMIENIEAMKEEDNESRKKNYEDSLVSLEYQLKTGDFFICANEKQKDYWVGMLSALNRITPELYDIDSSGDRLVGLVPFGIQNESPVHSKNVLKGVWPGIGEKDKVIIWGGGVWNWFDPLTLIRAVEKISKQRNDVKLFFMGVKHPNSNIPQMKMLVDAVKLAKDLKVFNKFVFFNFEWVDYNDRQNYLLEADLGVSCHFKTLETRFSFRTRILDYLWADLPIVCTEGDYFSDLVAKEKLGMVVGYEDVDMLAESINTLLSDEEMYQLCKRNVPKVAQDYKWRQVMKPLIEFCENPICLSIRSDKTRDKDSDEQNMTIQQRTGRHVHSRRPSGSVLDKLDWIDNRQDVLEDSLDDLKKQNESIYDTIVELQSWSYMMNDRFNKVKGALNPVRAIRKLFRRK